jgi:hypothetical protein
MAIELFQVEWTKIQTFNQALNQAVSQESGIYAMYKKTGSNINLHYIGKSKDFYKRSSTRRNAMNQMMTDAEAKKTFIGFGLISCFDKSRMSHDITPEQLKNIESFFINYFKPIGNDAITKKGYRGHTIIVFNTGKCFTKSKYISNSPELLKLLKVSFTTKSRSTVSTPWF